MAQEATGVCSLGRMNLCIIFLDPLKSRKDMKQKKGKYKDINLSLR